MSQGNAQKVTSVSNETVPADNMHVYLLLLLYFLNECWMLRTTHHGHLYLKNHPGVLNA
jgi:hypothetical protein